MDRRLEALACLKEGNKRFTSSNSNNRLLDNSTKLKMSSDQKPFAIILGCSDSRVPIEIIFDQGIGDLFVIRVAGNIVSPSLVGSIEYAVEQFGTSLIVVLGHSKCGAVTACVDSIKNHNTFSSNINSIINAIRPSVDKALITTNKKDLKLLVHNAIRANVKSSIDGLIYSSTILKKYVTNNKITIVGADYNLETGNVDFFESIPKDILF